jgi:hypothetical protein
MHPSIVPVNNYSFIQNAKGVNKKSIKNIGCMQKERWKRRKVKNMKRKKGEN